MGRRSKLWVGGKLGEIKYPGKQRCTDFGELNNEKV